MCFPFLKDYNSAYFGWSLVAEFGRRGLTRSLELGSGFVFVFFSQWLKAVALNIFSPCF